MLSKPQSILLIAVSLAIAIGVPVLAARRNAPECNWDERIKTSADALEFGKYWLRRETFWNSIGIKSIQELNAELLKDGCCHVQAINPEADHGREWFVSLKAERDKAFDFLYSVEFTSCGRSVETQILSSRY